MEPLKIVVIAASRDGFSALRTLAAGLPGDLPAAVCVVLHIGRHKSTLPELMSRSGPLPAAHAADGEVMQAGRIYVAPPDRHLIVEKGRLRLSDGAAENFSRPAADPLFRSAAMAYGSKVVGVVLSGDLDDGSAGLAAIRACGGACLVQDPQECEASSMPAAALRAVDGAATVAGIQDMAAAIGDAVRAAPLATLAKERAMKAGSQTEEEARVAARGFVSPEELDNVGERTALTCPECGGTLWQIKNARPRRYRCHTGHAFSEMSLEEGIVSHVERALWTAARSVREHLVYARERKDWAQRSGDSDFLVVESARVARAQELEAIMLEALRAVARTSGVSG
ncbi:chemotaxis protein CheB [Paraburkholderia sp. BR10936]|uniref:protein-glutamate methylesterase n=1 Tax=Paraburkholderia guartelaensis TaxID=2546446 RepID=A0ABU9S568_9BURK